MAGAGGFRPSGFSIALALVAAAVVACVATPAQAANGRLADLSLGLTSRTPATPTGMVVHVALHQPADPTAKPPALRTAVLHLPDGLRFDSTAMTECTASDAEIHALGPNACPADSKLTVGSLSAITGFGAPVDPLVGDDHVFNGPNQLIEVIAAPGTFLSPGFDRLTIDGSTVTAHPPATPGGPPDGQTAIKSIDFQVPVRTSGGKALITTPPACPQTDQWTTIAEFGFADGSTDTVTSATPCAASGQTSARPTLRLAVRPRRVTLGQTVRLMFRARSSADRCMSHARLRVGRRLLRTDDRGRAEVTMTFRRAGRHSVRIARAGCPRASATVDVRRAVRG